MGSTHKIDYLANIRTILINFQTNFDGIVKETSELNSVICSLQKKVKKNNSLINKFNKSVSLFIDETYKKDITTNETQIPKIIKKDRSVKPVKVTQRVRKARISILESSRHSKRLSEAKKNKEESPKTNSPMPVSKKKSSGITKKKIKVVEKKSSVNKNTFSKELPDTTKVQMAQKNKQKSSDNTLSLYEPPLCTTPIKNITKSQHPEITSSCQRPHRRQILNSISSQ